jgi:hypothetical protein
VLLLFIWLRFLGMRSFQPAKPGQLATENYSKVQLFAS